MNTDKKIISEIQKFNNIKNYISEQENLDLDMEQGDQEDLSVDTDLETDSEVSTEPIDIESDPDVEVVGDENTTEGTGTEELDVTDLVNSQNDILEKMGQLDQVFSKLDDLTNKLGEMESIMNKIDTLDAKIEKYKPKSPEQKLELRSLDSYPFNQKLTDFFDDKEMEFEKTGKSDYVLTTDDVENYTDNDIASSFEEPFKED